MGLGLVWFVLITVAVASWVIAYWRKGTVASAAIGSRRIEMYSPADPTTVFERLATMNDGKFKVDDKDADRKIIVLSSPITLMTFGFLYPVHLEAAGPGTRITIGIRSKAVQIGPLVTRAHEECEAAIRAALGVPEARVA